MGFCQKLKKLRLVRLIWILVILVAPTGCNSNKVKLTDEDEKFARLYADVLLVQANYDLADAQQKASFVKLDSLKAVFAIHKYSAEEFNQSLEKYKQDPVLWKEVVTKSMERLESRRRWLSDQPNHN